VSPNYKPCDISECSRSYLEWLAAELERQKAEGKPINQAYLDNVKKAIPFAPLHFITHEL